MPDRRIAVAVLTCSSAGYETARVIEELGEVARVTVVEAASPRPSSIWKRIRRSLRRHGLAGPMRALWRRMVPSPSSHDRLPPPAHHVRVERFHDDGGLTVLRGLGADLFVLDGTYILPTSVFDIPRLGTINLHCGYLPDFKGAPPVFWELYEGLDETGVSVHFVTADLDGGPIIDRRRFSIDPAPPGDPVEYAERTWREVLRPAGIRMLAEAVRRLARGGVETVPQTEGEGSVYRHPTHQQVEELRERVAARRRERR